MTAKVPRPGSEIGNSDIGKRIAGTNINADTFLATDYLNHFNEVVMLLEMLPDMPECLEDVKESKPKTYQNHFRNSVFSDRDLAIEAYDHVPSRYLIPFEDVMGRLNNAILEAVAGAERALAGGDHDGLTMVVATAMPTIQSFQDMASSIINGFDVTLDQSEIDEILKS